VPEALVPDGLRTPATFVLADRLERNLTRMADFAAGAGVALRPHAKTHKCLEIARRQVALGAPGVSVATIGEAEILTSAALTDPLRADVSAVFIAYPLWSTDESITRIRALTERAEVIVGADSAAAVRRLAPLAGRVTLLIEVDCGLSRTGLQPAAVPGLAQEAEKAGLEVRGVFTFPGHSYQPGGAIQAAADEAAALVAAGEALASVGCGGLVRSGGSSPSARLVHAGAVTEIRPGVYVFNDAQQVELGVVDIADVALMVASTVVSQPEAGRLVLDAGSKVLGPDRPAWATGHGRLAEWPEARIVRIWEHHAVVALDGPGPRLGDVVAVIPNHVCTAVNLVPELLVVDAGRVVDRWAVAARAANS
jgi:D-serine deaminase-like pyridoxal phosphate-dependent protein